MDWPNFLPFFVKRQMGRYHRQPIFFDKCEKMPFYVSHLLGIKKQRDFFLFISYWTFISWELSCYIKLSVVGCQKLKQNECYFFFALNWKYLKYLKFQIVLIDFFDWPNAWLIESSGSDWIGTGYHRWR